MKYIKDINREILFFVIFFYIIYCVSFAIFLDIIPTGINLDIRHFNLKTISVIGIITSGSIIYGITRYFNNYL